MTVSTLPTWFWALTAGMFGLAIGSFFTVCVSRWPAGESLVAPRSHCPCGRTLSWYELIPVVSWTLQGGRCRGCHVRISPRYPAIELATAGVATLAVLTIGANLRGAIAAVMLVALVPVVVIDIQHKLIPDVIILPAAAIALALAIVSDPARWWVPVAAAFGASGFLLALALVYPGGMGMGDVKLAFLLGATLGAAVIPALAIAFLVGAIVGVAIVFAKATATRKLAIPFGPFLAAGAAMALWWGAPLLGWYGNRLG